MTCTDTSTLPVTYGNSEPYTIVLIDEEDGVTVLDPTDYEVIFRVTHKGVELLRFATSDSPPRLVVVDQSLVFRFTPAETRLLPLGRIAKYSIERRWTDPDDGEPDQRSEGGFLLVTDDGNDDD